VCFVPQLEHVFPRASPFILAAALLPAPTEEVSEELLSICADESQVETSATIWAFFSSEQISSKLAKGGEPPKARIEQESILYGQENRSPRSKPESELLARELIEEPRLELAREYVSRSYNRKVNFVTIY
jgi:hypothetical protein